MQRITLPVSRSMGLCCPQPRSCGLAPRVQQAHANACRGTVVRVAAAASDRVQLGDSDLQVSAFCLGTMTYGKQNTEAEAHEQLSYATENGINFIDTAEMYPIPPSGELAGTTDRFIGTWLKKQKRSEIVLATKVSGYAERAWASLRDPPRNTRVEPDQIQQSVDASLLRLQTDHIDLLQIHWPDRYVPLFGQGGGYNIAKERTGDIPIEEQLRGLEAVIKQGKVRYVGVSNETSWGVSEFVNASKALGLPKVVSIQNCYNLLVRGGYETDLAETCRRTNVGLLAYSPLAGGSLSAKYNHGVFPGARFNLFPGYMERYNKSLTKTAVGEYEELGKKHGLSPVELALGWCKSRWFVASSIVGATTMDQLRENVAAFNAPPLSEEALADVEAIYKRFRDPTLY